MRVLLNWMPPIGAAVVVGDHRYEFVGHHFHQKRDGSVTKLWDWRGSCAACGRPFDCSSPEGVVAETRRCEDHRAPGKRARPMTPTTPPVFSGTHEE